MLCFVVLLIVVNQLSDICRSRNYDNQDKKIMKMEATKDIGHGLNGEIGKRKKKKVINVVKIEN